MEHKYITRHENNKAHRRRRQCCDGTGSPIQPTDPTPGLRGPLCDTLAQLESSSLISPTRNHWVDENTGTVDWAASNMDIDLSMPPSDLEQSASRLAQELSAYLQEDGAIYTGSDSENEAIETEEEETYSDNNARTYALLLLDRLFLTSFILQLWNQQLFRCQMNLHGFHGVLERYVYPG